ncbi:hypothetical protein V6N13_128278 [Hibiscus sabdariffa]|uniref:Glutaredoxin domain-containing protein n=1 Tax=Hibiscus sabdariffa TaxID=183260 RepID=A0ABR2P1S3_9ROSI
MQVVGTIARIYSHRETSHSQSYSAAEGFEGGDFEDLAIFSMDKVTRLASEKGVVLFSKSSCCMCYAVKILFQELGVTPMVHEIDQDPEGWEMEKALMRLGCNGPVPAIFIGGKLVGSTNEVMSLHLSGGLMPMLKPYQTLC